MYRGKDPRIPEWFRGKKKRLWKISWGHKVWSTLSGDTEYVLLELFIGGGWYFGVRGKVKMCIGRFGWVDEGIKGVTSQPAWQTGLSHTSQESRGRPGKRSLTSPFPPSPPFSSNENGAKRSQRRREQERETCWNYKDYIREWQQQRVSQLLAQFRCRSNKPYGNIPSNIAVHLSLFCIKKFHFLSLSLCLCVELKYPRHRYYFQAYFHEWMKLWNVEVSLARSETFEAIYFAAVLFWD